MKKLYNHTDIEKHWQAAWEKNNLYDTPEGATKETKYYILPQLPYPSGSGLHVGHAEVYTACDIFCRYKRMTGKKVLQVIGWDAFGLPAENYAIKNNVHPRINTNKAIDNFRTQIKSLGISVDWSREVGSHNPDYYTWTQWFFLLFYKRGLAYRKKQRVNWCDSCKTVLANEQVVEGKCERCSTEIIQKEMEQWYLKITEYADRLYKDLDKVDWPKESIKRQRDWIGRKEGTEVTFSLKVPGQEDATHSVTVFTTRADTIFGVTFLTISPEVAQKWIDVGWKAPQQVTEYVSKSLNKTDQQRLVGAKDKTGEFTGVVAVNPLNGIEVPVWVSDYVMGDVGTGALMGVPAHDERDFDFATKFRLPVKHVIRPVQQKQGTQNSDVFSDDGIVVESGEYSGMSSSEAREKITAWLLQKNTGRKTVTYKLRDWSVSRQRFWGAPIPMVYDPDGNLHPVDEKDLPVILPDDVDFEPTGQSPLTYSDSFQKGVDEKYGKGWKREVDTLDTFMCSSWYYFRYLDPHNNAAFASPESLKAWMPVDFYIGGVEHVNGHLLYSRFFTKVLFDAGYIDFDEPFLVHRHQGTILGEDNRKMSKRWGNVINPTDVVEKYGADTMRVYEMFMGPLEQDKSWNDGAVQGVRRFLTRLFFLASDEKKSRAQESTVELKKLLHKTIRIVTEDTAKLKFNTAIARFMEFTNEWTKDNMALSPNDTVMLLTILAPYTPHMAEELFQDYRNQQIVNSKEEFNSIHTKMWPAYDPELVKEDMVTVVVQVNGKVRGTLPVDTQTANSKQQIVALAKTNEQVKKYLSGATIKKEIFVQGKLVNFVT